MRGLRGVGIQGLASPVFCARCPGGASLYGTMMALNPNFYWPLDELAGATAINYGTAGAAGNGTYNGCTLAQIAAPGGVLAPLFDGDDFVNIYSAALAAAFAGGVGDAGSIVLWARVFNAGVWTDASERRIIHINAGADYIYIGRHATNNLIRTAYRASGGGAAYDGVDISTSLTSWMQIALTWTHDGGDELKAYINGVQSGVTQTALAGWVTALTATGCCIGSFNTASITPFYGYISNVGITSGVLSPTTIANIYAVGSV